MAISNNKEEQDEKLAQMNYSPENDIFAQEEHISLDGDGNPVDESVPNMERLGDDLDVPGVAADDDMERIGSEDEENNFYSLSDNQDNHEASNEDLLS